MALLQTLSDPFNTSSLNTSLWTQFTDAGTLPTFSYNLGQNAQVNFPASTTGSTDGDLTSVSTYDLTNSFASINVLAVPTSASNADADFRVQTASNNYLRWVYEGGTLFAQQNVAGAKTTVFSVAYNPITHAWWRIRHQTAAGGHVLWDTSADGISWTQQFSSATVPITVTALTVFIGGIGTGVASSPGTFTFASFNTIPVRNIPPLRIASKRVGPMAMRHSFKLPQPTPDVGVVVSSSTVTQVAATLTFTGGTQAVTSVQDSVVAQSAATLTFTGGTQSVANINDTSAAQIAGTLTFTGGTQTILGTSFATVTQVGAVLTFTGGTQSAGSVVNATVTQVGATLTFTGGTQSIATVNDSSVAQVHATLTLTGGTQTDATSNFSTLAQVAATLTFTGGTQAVASSQKASATQVAATITFTGGTQSANAQASTSTSQVAATLTFTGGTQVLVAAFTASVSQAHATLTFSGGIQSVFIPAVYEKVISLGLSVPGVLPIAISQALLPISLEVPLLPISLPISAPIAMTLMVDNELSIGASDDVIAISLIIPAPIAFTLTAN